MTLRLDLTHDAAAFLTAAADHLAVDPVLATVVATHARRTTVDAASGVAPPADDWWLTVRDPARGGRVVGVGMRTAPFAPRPPYLLPMPDDAAVALARTLHDRGEEVLAAAGALPTVEVFLAETARLAGGSAQVEVAQHTRLFSLADLATLSAPRPAPGRLRAARADDPADVETAVAWFAAFRGDADEQAGRPRGTLTDTGDPGAVRRRVEAGCVWFWEDEHGRPVHLTAANPPAYGVVRLGPVYTPPAERGRGWAGAAVHAVTRRVLADGSRACLVTDQANPTSNRLYAGLGYRAVVDMAHLRITTRGRRTPAGACA